MSMLHRSPIAVFFGSLPAKRPRLCRASVLASEPRYRRLRAVLIVAGLRPLRHAALGMRLAAQWHRVRGRTSWSRA